MRKSMSMAGLARTVMVGGAVAFLVVGCDDDGGGDQSGTDAAVDAPVGGQGGAAVSPDGGVDGPGPDGALPMGDGGPGDGGPAVTACVPGAPRPISNGVGASSAPAIVWDGTRYLVVWSDQRTGRGDILLSRLDASGAPASVTEEIPLVPGDVPSRNPEIAARPGGGYVLVFEDCEGFVNGDCTGGASVKSLLLDANGAPAGTVKTLSPGQQTERRPQLVQSGGKAFVTFRVKEGANVTVKVAALDAGGELAAGPQPLDIAPAGVDALFPQLGTDGTALALVYVEGSGNSLVKLELLNQALMSTKQVTLRSGQTGEAANPHVSWTGDEWLVTWEDGRSGEERAWAALVSADGTARPGFEIWNQNGNWPVSASGGQSSLIAFHGFPNGAQVIGQALNAGGERVGMLLGLSPLETHNGRLPALVYNPQDKSFGLVYEERKTEEITFVRVTCP